MMWQINQNMWKKKGERRIDLIVKYKWENKIKESTGERKKTENVEYASGQRRVCFMY